MSLEKMSRVEDLPGYTEFLEFLKEEKVSESDPHSSLIHYLLEVLKWLYHLEGWYMNTDMGIFQPGYKGGVAPDVALFKGVVLSESERANLTSWLLLNEPNRPAPSIVFEIASESTWQDDVEPDKKPLRYEQMGVKEYFTYDPHTPQVWRKAGGRLRGWRYPGQELQPDEQGRLWSEELASHLVPDGLHLRLYDLAGQRRLTEAEATDMAYQREVVARQQEAIARRHEAVARQQEAIARRHEAVARQQAEQRAIEAEQQEAIAKQRAVKAEQQEAIAKQRAVKAEQQEAIAKHQAAEAEQKLAELQQQLEQLRRQQPNDKE